MIPFHFIETAKAIHLDDDTIKIVLAIDADKKIVAIKELRIRTGCGLSEAKWLVENHPQLAPRFNPPPKPHPMLIVIDKLEDACQDAANDDTCVAGVEPIECQELCRLARIALSLGHGR